MSPEPAATDGGGRRVTAVLPSPIGPLTLVAVDGALVGLRMAEHRHAPAPGSDEVPDDAAFVDVAAQLTAYFAGGLDAFDVPLALGGTPFQQLVWTTLAEIPYGSTTTYGELAASIGQPGAARAVGLANGRNPVSIIVPCHRVVGADGSLTGYGGGTQRKRFLLELERGSAGLW